MCIFTSCAKARDLETPIAPFEVPISVPDTIATVAGVISIQTIKAGCIYEMTLKGARIFGTNCNNDADLHRVEPIISVLKFFDGGPAPFDQVIAIQQNHWGLACNGGSIWFLGLQSSDAYQVSADIDFCGGAAAVLRAEPGKLLVHKPGGPPNRGEGYIPSETWAFDGRTVRKLRASAL